MSICRRAFHGLSAIVLAVVFVCITVAQAQEPPARTITAVDPAVLSQGETVLLTITGENLPTGTVVVEFFPQHIALLDVLASSESEVLAQIKVPNLAPPGSYNVLVYNHLGEEAFAEGLLYISGTVITPVFRDYTPKEIGEAGQGFALLMTGDAVTEGAIPFLSMRWSRDGQELPRLETTFSKGAPGQVVCAVTGEVPAGVLQGRVYLHDKPIYLVEVTVKGTAGLIVGHRPMSFDVAGSTYAVELLGTGFDAGFLGALNVELSTPQITARPASVSLADQATITAMFSGPLPAGVYQLGAKYRDEIIYRGEVQLVAASEAPAMDAGGAGTAAPEAGGDEHSENAGVAPAVDMGTSRTDVSTVNGTPPQAPATSLRDPVVLPATARAVAISFVAPLAIAAGERPASLAVTGVGLSAAVVERLELSLDVDGRECPLLFLGAGEGSFTCLFGPPGEAWLAGTAAMLTIADPHGALGTYTAELSVEGITPRLIATAVPSVEPPATPPVGGTASDWSVDNVYVKAGADGGTLTVVLNAPAGSWDSALLSGSFVLLPTQTIVSRAFSNITFGGKLAFRRSESGVPIGSFTGNFASGDLLVEVRYAGGGVTVSTMSLDAPIPRAELIAPAVEYIRLESADGRLQPGSLRWVVEFAPLVVTDPSFLIIEFTPPATMPYQVARRAEGTQVVFTQQLAAWEGVASWEGELICTVDSSIGLDWLRPPKMSLPVEEVAPVHAGLSFHVAADRCLIDDDGFELVLVPSGELPPLARLSDVVLESDNLLLDRNVDKFTAQALATSAEGQPAVLLCFRRDRDALSDVAFSLLADELVDGSPVSISLRWDGLGISLSESVIFTHRDTSATGDPLEELSLRHGSGG